MSELPKGGGFLLGATDPQSIFTNEDFSTEHELIAETANGFIEKNVMPQMDDLEEKKPGLLPGLVRKFGELGLLAADIPEEYGGIESDKISAVIIAEAVGRTGSFCIGHTGQVGIGSLPIVFFGNDQQKKKYLPDVATGAKIAAYALTEPGAGSDAMGLKTKAVLSPDGKHYIINGAKQFISNVSFGEIFIVFAKIDGEKLTAFIVDGGTEGFSTGEEEKKMGLKGSSTRTLYFDDMKVPVENLLFEPGRGHIVAFNILNIGRLKTAANSLGSAKWALELSATYANERRQFNVPIATFGMIQEKLARMAYGIYATESAIYRTSGLINDKLESLDTSGPDGGQVVAKGIEEYAIECSLVKVFASEVQAYVVNDGVQIHGGYGFMSEYPIERLYRDARIYPIFEGTNEINRNLIPTMLMRRASQGRLSLPAAVDAMKQQVGAGIPPRAGVADLVQASKDVFLFTMGVCLDKCGDQLLKEQEMLGRLADLVILSYAMESALLRAQKATEKRGERAGAFKMKLATAFIYNTMEKLGPTAEQILAAVSTGDELIKLRAHLAGLMQYIPINTIALNRKIASKISETGKYRV